MPVPLRQENRGQRRPEGLRELRTFSTPHRHFDRISRSPGSVSAGGAVAPDSRRRPALNDNCASTLADGMTPSSRRLKCCGSVPGCRMLLSVRSRIKIIATPNTRPPNEPIAKLRRRFGEEGAAGTRAASMSSGVHGTKCRGQAGLLSRLQRVVVDLAIGLDLTLEHL